MKRAQTKKKHNTQYKHFIVCLIYTIHMYMYTSSAAPPAVANSESLNERNNIRGLCN